MRRLRLPRPCTGGTRSAGRSDECRQRHGWPRPNRGAWRRREAANLREIANPDSSQLIGNSPLGKLLDPSQSPGAARGPPTAADVSLGHSNAAQTGPTFYRNLLNSDGAAATRLRSLHPDQLDQLAAQGPPRTAQDVLNLATGTNPAPAGSIAEWDRQQTVKQWFADSRNHPADFDTFAAALPATERAKLNQAFEDNKPGQLSQPGGLSYWGRQASKTLTAVDDWGDRNLAGQYTPGSWEDRWSRSARNFAEGMPAQGVKALDDLLTEDEARKGNAHFQPLADESAEHADQRLHPFTQDLKGARDTYTSELGPIVGHGDTAVISQRFHDDPVGTAMRYLPIGGPLLKVGGRAAGAIRTVRGSGATGVEEATSIAGADRTTMSTHGAPAATAATETPGGGTARVAAPRAGDRATAGPDTSPAARGGTPTQTPDRASTKAIAPPLGTGDHAAANPAPGPTGPIRSAELSAKGSASPGRRTLTTGQAEVRSAPGTMSPQANDRNLAIPLTEHLNSVVPPRRGVFADQLGLSAADHQALPQALRDNADFTYFEHRGHGFVRRTDPLDRTESQYRPKGVPGDSEKIPGNSTGRDDTAQTQPRQASAQASERTTVGDWAKAKWSDGREKLSNLANRGHRGDTDLPWPTLASRGGQTSALAAGPTPVVTVRDIGQWTDRAAQRLRHIQDGSAHSDLEHAGQLLGSAGDTLRHVSADLGDASSLADGTTNSLLGDPVLPTASRHERWLSPIQEVEETINSIHDSFPDHQHLHDAADTIQAASEQTRFHPDFSIDRNHRAAEMLSNSASQVRQVADSIREARGYVNDAWARLQGSAKQPTTPSSELVPLFRNVTGPEFDELASTGKFASGNGSMEDKWFASTGAHAEKWGEVLNRGQGLTVTTEIPKDLVEQLYYDHKLDGIGPAYAVSQDQLAVFNQMMNGIRMWP